VDEVGSATEKSGPPASPLAGLSAGYASRSSRATTLDAPKAPHHSQLALKEVLRFYMLDRWFLLWLLLFTALLLVDGRLAGVVYRTGFHAGRLYGSRFAVEWS